jgi:hypothetical protein
MSIWKMFRPFGTPILWPFGNLVANWYNFPRLGRVRKKSGKPGVIAEQCSTVEYTSHPPPPPNLVTVSLLLNGDKRRKLLAKKALTPGEISIRKGVA